VDSALYSSVKTSWSSFLESIEQLGSVIATFSEDTQKVADSIARTEKERAKPYSSLTTQGKNLLSELKKFEGNTGKAKEKFIGCKRKHEESLQEYMSAKDTQAAGVVSKLGKKADADAKSEEKADKELQKSVESLRTCQEKVFCKELPNILTEIEKMEKDRIELIHQDLQNLMEAEMRTSPVIKDISEKFHKSVQSISPQADLQQFAEKICTGKQLVLATYENVNEQASSSNFSSSGGLNNNPSTRRLSVGHNSSSNNSTSVYNIPKQAQTHEKVTSLYAYTAVDANELSFPAQAQITVLLKDDSGWWQGEYQGKVGIFPYNFVESPTTAATAVNSQTNSGNKTMYRALYDYIANDSEELSFSTGEEFTLESESEGWLFVYNSKQEFGRIPSTYTEVIE